MSNVPQDADEQADSATMGAAHHGIAQVRGQQAVPLSPLHEGRFGCMFRDPQALRPDDDALKALAKLIKGERLVGRRRQHGVTTTNLL